jgi:hypothetical protein
VIGIIGGSLGAIAALPSIGGNYPWWSLGIFFLCVYVVHGIFVYGDEEKDAGHLMAWFPARVPRTSRTQVADDQEGTQTTRRGFSPARSRRGWRACRWPGLT